MRVIQVGVGKMGRNWLQVLRDHDDVELVGVVEPVEFLRTDALAVAGLETDQGCASLEEALAVEFDAAVVVTPPATHRPISEQLLRAGKHVLQEKPLATSIEDAEALVEIAASSGRTLMVAQNYRHFEGYLTVKQVLDSGRLGEIAAVHIRFDKNTRTMFGEGDFRYSMEQPLLVDMSIHHFDMLRGLLGRDAINVFAQTWHVPDGNYSGHAAATVLFAFAGGIPVAYDGNWASYRPETSWNGAWEIVGEHGRLIWAGGDWAEVEVTFTAHGGEEEQVALVGPAVSGQVSLLTEFVSAIADGRVPVSAAADNIHSLEMVFAAVESASTGQVVTLPWLRS